MSKTKPSPARPRKGGSFIVQPGGKLKQTAGTKPAERRTNGEPDSPPADPIDPATPPTSDTDNGKTKDAK